MEHSQTAPYERSSSANGSPTPPPKGGGTLQARRTSRGVAFYFRYSTEAGKTVRLPIGAFDSKGRGGLSLTQARTRVGELSKRYTAGERDLRAALAADAADAERARIESVRSVEAATMRERGTLGLLLGLYADDLEARGKPSAREVRAACERHIHIAHSKLWVMPAADVTVDDLMNVVSPLVKANKRNEGRKLRSYLCAAYTAAIRSRQDPDGVQAMRELALTSNPVANLVAIAGATNAHDRALSIAELRAYWTRIAKMRGAAGAALRVHLLSGGQRVEQLARLTTADYDGDTRTIRLRDGKGRRKVARDHHVPLIPAAVEAIEAMLGGAAGEYLFTFTSGVKPATPAALSKHLRRIVGAMEAAGELEKGRFAASDIRRTVETRLAAAGVSSDVRAQLQSHGLGGIQSRHYDRHNYLAEKRAALETLHKLLTGAAATVSTMRLAKA